MNRPIGNRWQPTATPSFVILPPENRAGDDRHHEKPSCRLEPNFSVRPSPPPLPLQVGVALHEQLGMGGGGAGAPFYHIVESPYEDFDDDFTGLRACEATHDRSRSTAAWRVDGRTVYEAHGTLIPEHARIGFAIWTMQPIRDGRSRSLNGQGMNARWRRFRVRGVNA